MATQDGGVYVVGAGLAGPLRPPPPREGRGRHRLEASDGVGGRVRTDRVDDFLLDRGFQALLTAYPEAAEALDYRSWSCTVLPGGDGPHRRPVRDRGRPVPAALGRAAHRPGPGGHARRQAEGGACAAGWWPGRWRSCSPARDHHGRPWRQRLLGRHRRPLLPAAVRRGPARPGAGHLQPHVRVRLPDVRPGRRRPPDPRHGRHRRAARRRPPPDCVRLGQRVTAVGDGGVTLAGGEKLPARAVVVATDGPTASSCSATSGPGRSR